jgi:hypothetical protein
MAGLIGNQAWLAAGKQSAKGAAATAPKHMWGFAGGNVEPSRQIESLQETDSDRDPGVSYVSRVGVEGSSDIYVRDSSMDFWIAAALGAVVDSGTMPNFSHAITPANALPYLTVWRMVGNALFEQFTDVMVNELTIRAEAGGPLMASVGLVGITPARLASDPSAAWTGPPVVVVETAQVYTFNDATVTLGGSGTSLVSGFELSINNNIVQQQTDDVKIYDVVPGQREVSLSFDYILESLGEYNKFHYGGVAGTAVSSSIYTTDLLFSFDRGANNQVLLDINSFAYEEFPVEPQPDGSPVTVAVRGRGQRTTGDMVTATVKNAKATTY